MSGGIFKSEGGFVRRDVEMTAMEGKGGWIEGRSLQKQ